MPAGNGRRVAVVAGRRTPFCRSGTALKDVRAVDLARFVARELLERTDLAGAEVDAVIFGQVVPSALVPNVVPQSVDFTYHTPLVGWCARTEANERNVM